MMSFFFIILPILILTLILILIFILMPHPNYACTHTQLLTSQGSYYYINIQ